MRGFPDVGIVLRTRALTGVTDIGTTTPKAGVTTKVIGTTKTMMTTTTGIITTITIATSFS
jgi:hypothetical protein